MRKSKIAKLFDWKAYQEAQEALAQSPDQKDTIKKATEQDKVLQIFESAVTKDLRLGLKALQGALKEEGAAEIPYFLHLNYFARAKERMGSLLIFGTHPAIRKEFIAAGKTAEKINLSYGVAQLDSNHILRFIPEKNGMKVKPKSLVDGLKKAPIAKSNPGFWSKRKINNVIIGTPEETEGLIGDSDLVDKEVTYTESGINSEVYDIFKSFVNKDYTNSKGTRNAEYYAQTLKKVDQWVTQLQVEFKAKGDKKLQKAYKKMGTIMLAFKKKVQQEIQNGKTQHINEESSLSNIEQVFMRTLKEHEASDDPYQQSVLKGKLERILLELGQKINGEEQETEALALQNRLQGALATLVSDTSDTNEGVSPIVQRELAQLVEEMKELLQLHTTAPLS